MTNELNATIAVRYNITVKQNQTFNPLISFIDSSDNPISLAGSTAKLSVRQDGAACDGGCDGHDNPIGIVYKQDFIPTITGASNNKLQFNNLILLTEGYYKYDLIIEWPSGEQQYYLTGSFRVKKSYSFL